LFREKELWHNKNLMPTKIQNLNQPFNHQPNEEHREKNLDKIVKNNNDNNININDDSIKNRNDDVSKCEKCDVSNRN
jgi:hypothetical protein